MHKTHSDLEESYFSSSKLANLPYAVTAPLVKRIARSLVWLFLVLMLFLAVTPWQQNIRGVGRVIAY